MSDLQAILGEVIDTAITLAGADFGHIQLLDPEGNLRIVAHRGFSDRWVEYWSTVKDQHCACVAALAANECVIVEDVEQSPVFFGTLGLETLLKEGVRAMQSRPLRGSSGQIVGMFSIHWRKPCRSSPRILKVLDMLAAHAATLIEREARFRAIVETTADGFWMLDDEGHLITVNDVYLKRSGYRREDLLTMNLADLEAKETHEEFRQHMEDVRRKGNALFETKHRAKSGEIWPVEINVTYRPEAGGKFFAFLRDITKRKQADRALRQARDLLADAQKIAHLGSFEYVAATGKIRWSEEEFHIYGLEPNGVALTFEEMLSRFIHPEDAKIFQKEFSSAMKKQKVYELEHRIIRPDGSVRWIHNLAQPFFDEQKNLLRYVGTTMDITERKHEESEAQKQNELMQSLVRQQVAVHTAATFAHELNQPLVSIVAYNEVALSILNGGKGKPAQLAKAVEGSHEQALRAGQALHELIEYLHKADVEPSAFDINDLVKHVIKEVRRMGFLGFESTLFLEPDLPSVLGNRLQTEKVLLNLIENGIEAMKASGIAPLAFEISVRTQADSNMAQVTVRDSGPGLDMVSVQRIFSPFFTTKPEGLGMGLAISRSLIEAQGGNLWFDPEDKAGAVFHFTLPFAESYPASPANLEKPVQTRNGKQAA